MRKCYCKRLDERGTLELDKKAPAKKKPKLDEKASKLLLKDLRHRTWAPHFHSGGHSSCSGRLRGES
jgi:transposase